MQLGMISLGRMGANIVRRAMGKDHKCVAYDHDPQAVKTSADEGGDRTLPWPMTQRKETE